MVAKLTKGSCLSVSSINKTPLASPLFYNSPMGEVGIISFPTLYNTVQCWTHPMLLVVFSVQLLCQILLDAVNV